MSEGSSSGMSPISSTSTKMNSMINELEETRAHSFCIMDLSEKYGIKHRRLYDLFNLLTAMGVTKHSGSKQIDWLGLSNMDKFIERKYIQYEKKSDSEPIPLIFGLAQSPPLGEIATNFLVLFPFFRIKKVSLRKASTLFNQNGGDLRSFERRMYLVLGLLENLGYLSHLKRSGQYETKMNIENLLSKSFLFRRELSLKKNPNSIEALLSRDVPSYFLYTYSQRRKIYENVMSSTECSTELSEN